MKRIYIKTFAILFTVLFATSCTKNWETMNTDPNNPKDAAYTNVLAHSIRYIGSVMFDDWQGMNNFCSYTGQITKIQYTDEAHYQYRDNVVYNAWSDYYETQLDLSKLIEKAKAAGNSGQEGAALTWSVYLWQMAADQWGNIPYSQAIQGESKGNYTPVYDKPSAIYNSLFAKIEEANDLLAHPKTVTGSTDQLGEGDIIYHGSFAEWQKFANSIHLRLAMRISNVDPAKAQAEVEKILGDPSKYPIFESRDDEAKLKWTGAPYYEPYYYNHYIRNRDDHGMAKTLIDTLLSFNDPRIAAFAKRNSAGLYVGQVEGSKSGDVRHTSRIGAMYRDDPKGYTYFLRYAEVQFNIAEAGLRGWNIGSYTANGAYAAGIAASFDETYSGELSPLDVKNESADLAAYMANPKVALTGVVGAPFNMDPSTDLVKVYIQKWISMFKEGQELWALQRRTNYPPMAAAPGSNYPGHNVGPFRYPYPSTEFNLNGTNATAASAGIVDHFWGKQLFWDVRTGVH